MTRSPASSRSSRWRSTGRSARRSCRSARSSAARSSTSRSARSSSRSLATMTDKAEAFERMVRLFGLIEMMRTGEIAIWRGRGETWRRAAGRSRRPRQRAATDASASTAVVVPARRRMCDCWLIERAATPIAHRRGGVERRHDEQRLDRHRPRPAGARGPGRRSPRRSRTPAATPRRRGRAGRRARCAAGAGSRCGAEARGARRASARTAGRGRARRP